MQGQASNLFRLQELYDEILKCALMNNVVTEETIFEFQELINEAKPCNDQEWFAYDLIKPMLQNNSDDPWPVRNAFNKYQPYMFLWMQALEIVCHLDLRSVVFVKPESKLFDCKLVRNYAYEQIKVERKSYSLPASPAPKVIQPATVKTDSGATYAQITSGKPRKITPSSSRKWSDIEDDEDFSNEPHPIVLAKEEAEKKVEKQVEKEVEKPSVKPVDSLVVEEKPKDVKILSAEDMEIFKKFNEMYEKMNEDAQKIKKIMEKFN